MATHAINTDLQQAYEQIIGGQTVAYKPVIAKVFRSVTAGLFLSQLIYWAPRAHDPQGWIYKTQDEMYHETGMTRREQETARRILREAGVLQEKLQGVPAKLHFRVDLVKLNSLLASSPTPGLPPSWWHLSTEGEGVGDVQASMAESAKLDWPKPTNKKGGKRHAITENTTKINNRDSAVFDSKGRKVGKNDHLVDQKQQTPLSQNDLADASVVAGEESLPARSRRMATPQLDAAIDAASAELGEGHKASSNRSRARRELVELPDAVAAAYLRRALAKTRAHLRDTGGVSKRMPYFFAVLDQLRAEAAAPRATTDLAGKYAAKVMR